MTRSLYDTDQQYCQVASDFVQNSNAIFNYQYQDMQNNDEIYSYGLTKQPQEPQTPQTPIAKFYKSVFNYLFPPTPAPKYQNEIGLQSLDALCSRNDDGTIFNQTKYSINENKDDACESIRTNYPVLYNKTNNITTAAFKKNTDNQNIDRFTSKVFQNRINLKKKIISNFRFSDQRVCNIITDIDNNNDVAIVSETCACRPVVSGA